MPREIGLIQRVRLRLGDITTSPSPHLQLGVSGGPDSVALALVASELVRLNLIEATICHVDHGVRSESAKDGEFVQSLAQRLNLPCIVRQIPAENLQRHAGVGPEEAMRRERYRIFADLSRELDCTMLALGHHQHDQVETVLLHLLRGSGLRGVGGMAPISSLDVPWWEAGSEPFTVQIWRPFLSEPREVLRQFLQDRNTPSLADPTNDDVSLRRNALRHRIMPVIEDEFPGSAPTIASFADIAREDESLLSELVDDWLRLNANDLTMKREAVKFAHPALRRRALRAWIVATIAPTELSRERVEAVASAATASSSGQIIELGSGWFVKITRDQLELIQSFGPP